LNIVGAGEKTIPVIKNSDAAKLVRRVTFKGKIILFSIFT
jgi:hypothetical protein